MTAVFVFLLNLLVLWPLYCLMNIVLIVLGFIAVPLAIEFGNWQMSNVKGILIYTAPRWLWLWGNDEDGYLSPEVFRHAKPTWSKWYTMFEWAAIRNNVGNLRFIKLMHPPQRADKVRWVTVGSYTFVWQGILGNLIHNDANRQAGAAPWWWFGWKYEPERADATGWKALGQGFGIRIVRVKK
jgi:hypothetical protein